MGVGGHHGISGGGWRGGEEGDDAREKEKSNTYEITFCSKRGVTKQLHYRAL